MHHLNAIMKHKKYNSKTDMMQISNFGAMKNCRILIDSLVSELL